MSDADEARKSRNQAELRRFLDRYLQDNPDESGVCTGCGKPAAIGVECCIGSLVRSRDETGHT